MAEKVSILTHAGSARFQIADRRSHLLETEVLEQKLNQIEQHYRDELRYLIEVLA